MSHRSNQICPDCVSESQLESAGSRRAFLKSSSVAAVAAGIASVSGLTPRLFAAPSSDSGAETAVKALYSSFSEEQVASVCLPFEHELRHRIDANWRISKINIGSDFYSQEQRGLIDQIIRGVTSEDGYERLKRQMKDDAGGIGRYAMTIFGEPGSGKFQWEMTGRHLTLRADGDSAPGAAFGGPIIYGHSKEEPSKNLFYYQTQKANEVFEALDEKQARAALVDESPEEDAVALQGLKGRFPGVAVSELSSDQKQLVADTIKVLLNVYRQEDVDEVMSVLNKGGGVDSLHMAYYPDSDVNGDRIWDVWRIEGPSFVWHFRGDPHVHAYINIGLKSEQASREKRSRRRPARRQ